MNKDIIKKYASDVEKKDILNFAQKENVSINENELSILHDLIKNNADKLLNNNFHEHIKIYKDKFNPSLYSKIIEKYDKYKNFID